MARGWVFGPFFWIDVGDIGILKGSHVLIEREGESVEHVYMQMLGEGNF